MRLTLNLLTYPLVLILAAISTSAAIAHSFAPAQAPATSVTANVAVRVRTGPATTYTQIGVVYTGVTVPVTGRNSNSSWLFVEYLPGRTGWVAGWLVTPNGDPSGLPVVISGGEANPPPSIPTGPGVTGRTISPVNLRPQPNTSLPPITWIPGGTTISVLGRNATATWLYVNYNGQLGWVSAPYVVVIGSTVYALPVVGAGSSPAPTQPPAPTPVPQPANTGWYSYVHNITPRAHDIFVAGQARGNRADVFSKVGDSITASWAFLGKIGEGIYSLNEYSYLQPVINYYSVTTARTHNSFNNDSLAAVEGWWTNSLLDPANAGACPGYTPIECEYMNVRPAVAIIMIGTNDVHGGIDSYTSSVNLARIVEITINSGVIPVLSTIPYNEPGDAPTYNQIVVSTANTYGIPWMDFYAATINLPAHGMDPDMVHPAVPPTHDPTNFTPDTLQYGFTVRNLVTLHALDAVWRQVLTK